MQQHTDLSECCRNEVYKPLHWANDNNEEYKSSTIVPVQDMELEGELFPAPHNSREFLEQLYGCLEKGAVFDKATGKYKMPDRG